MSKSNINRHDDAFKNLKQRDCGFQRDCGSLQSIFNNVHKLPVCNYFELNHILALTHLLHCCHGVGMTFHQFFEGHRLHVPTAGDLHRRIRRSA